MKKMNTLLVILVSVICVAAAFFIFRGEEHPYKKYYDKLETYDEFVHETSYFDLKVNTVSANKFDIIIDNPSEPLKDFRAVIVPNNFDKHKTYSSIGLTKQKFILCSSNYENSDSNYISVPGFNVGVNFEEEADSLYFYVEFLLENNITYTEVYLKIDV